MTLAQQSFDLFQTVADLAKGLPEAEERDVHLEVSGPATGAPMRGDLTRIRAAFAAIL